jgi:chromosome segregation ATPase
MEARGVVERLEAQRQETERRLQRLREDSARLDAEGEQVRRQIAADETRAASWREEIVKVSADRLQCLARHGEIQQELQKLTETQHQGRVICDELETKRNRLEADVTALDSEQARRTAELAEADASVQRLRSERNELENAIRQAMEGRAKAEKQRENALEALQHDLPRLAKAQSELVNTERELGTMSQDLARVREELVAVQQAEEEMSDQLANAKQEISSTEKTLTALRTEHTDILQQLTRDRDRLATMKREIGSTEEKLETGRRELKETEAELAHVSAGFSELDGRFVARRVEFSDLEKLLETATRQHRDIEADLLTKSRLLADTQTSLTSATQKLASTQHQLEATNRQHEQAEAKLRERNDWLTKAEEQTTEARKALESSSRDLNFTLAELAKTRLSLDTAQSHFNSQSHSLAELLPQVATSTQELQRLRDELYLTTQKLESTRHDLAGTSDELSHTSGQLAALRKEHAAAQIRREELLAAATRAESHLHHLDSEVANRSRELETLQSALRDGESRAVGLNATLENLSATHTDLQNRIIQQEEKENELRTSIAALTESEARAVKSEAWQKEQLTSLAGLVHAVQQELTDAEDILTQTQQWTERSRKARERLDSLEAGSLEERNCRNEIDIVSAGLRQLLNRLSTLRTQPSVIASIRAEKAESTLAPVFTSPPSSQEEPSESETALAGRLAKLREAAMREESRIEFLKDERERLEKIARARPTIDPAVSEQEDKLRLLQEQVSLAESRLKRTAAEEQNHREKIASLRQQLAQLRDGMALSPSLS